MTRIFRLQIGPTCKNKIKKKLEFFIIIIMAKAFITCVVL